ncbi:MAG: T9SS type A sorting domain-containing protein, partial [Candidatus Cloacimonetes bacterium]|nr:T9SS type A sorting domain-containing protein [Candidatus Cloacimonadota bacterium]
ASKNKMIIYQDTAGITSDDYFCMFRQDSRPEIPIGRIPAKTSSELDLVLDRIEEWNTSINPGWWRNSVLFIADDDVNGFTSGEYYHTEQAEAASATLNRGIISEKIYAYDYELDEYQNKPETAKDIVAQINEGALIWYYIGHGSYDKLGTEDYFNAITDISKLTNADKMNLFIAASCDVGEFDSYNFDSLGEQLLFSDNGGSIATISATRECYGTMNTELIKFFLRYNCNNGLTIGESLMLAKIDSPYPTNDKKYVLLGDPMLYITPPPRDEQIIIVSDDGKIEGSYNAREKVTISGGFLNSTSSGTADFRAYDSDKFFLLPNLNDYSYNGNAFYNGKITVSDGSYNASFIIPDDIRNGSLGRTIAYFYDGLSGKDFISTFTPLTYSRQPLSVVDITPPEVTIWLDSDEFQDGQWVSSTPLFHADFYDESGINTLGSPGHKILLSIDDNAVMLDLSDEFIYAKDSFTTGTVDIELTNLEVGNHTATLVVFDNFNNPRVQSVDFETTKSEFILANLLPYPNPMPKNGGWITFIVSDESDYTIKLYTITGKKIRTLKGTGKNYIQVAWDGRDDRGSKLANGTYFIKAIVKSRVSGSQIEKTEKLVIFDK